MTSATTQTPTFADLGVPASLVDVLVAEGRPTPFPIQEATLPSTLAGRDVLGRGKTGSGKTLAFAIPLVARLAALGAERRAGAPTGLVLAPTRELATQITRVIEPLAAASGMKVTTIFGGVSQRPQETALRAGVDIVVACPGRLEDLIGQKIVRLDRVAITVLDEADHMADLGFLPGVTRLLSQTPAGGQRLFFSATLDNGIDKLVKRFLNDPVHHSIDPAESPVAAMTHHVFEIDADAKNDLVFALASGAARRLLFTRTKHQAKKLARQLTAKGIPAVDLHGNLSQNARDRNLADFASGAVKVLVATDVAARGVHVDGIELVVHVDPPAEHKAYLHRSGRTARAGSSGDVVTIMLPAQRRDTKDLLRRAAIAVTPQVVTASHPAVVALIGEVAPRVAPGPGLPGAGNPPAPGATGGGQSQGANARRKRAVREGVAEAPREGSGRSGGSRRRGGQGGQGRAGQAATGQRRTGQSQGGRSGQRSGGSSAVYSTSSGSSAPRTPRRAQG
ncbi:DEAD/DEAH box helicase [Microbacterium sediminis]|uniref:DEAD/DEAH box helicase n=1 Tax=Microbacterium sediminis TaxID=904291 RepID=A0A1B9ND78_9MICO|nr:DEAD/DEAH box helicase [Microbacterium sediminis]OCG74552.1 DEAD/DEAH box helicase [Microbacterium sediminis]QBR74852.1 DEAD/DEAH box helicase [Microbacterium sediminis]